MTTQSDDSSQSGVSPLGPTVPLRERSERLPAAADLAAAPPFSRSSRREAMPDRGSRADEVDGEMPAKMPAEEPMEKPAPAPTEDLLNEQFGEILMADDLDFSGEDDQVDELPWLADLPETPEASADSSGASGASATESGAPEWLDWLDGMDDAPAVEPAPEPEEVQPEPPSVTAGSVNDDALLEIAARLEKIAASLRTGSAGTLLSEQSTDPLAALVAGYALGYARRRGEGTDR